MGWILLIAGILIIFWSLYSSYNIFTGKRPAPQVFQQEEGFSQTEDSSEMQETIRRQIESMVPPIFVSRILNLASWALFVGILIFGGSKVSLLGIRLVKK